MPYWYWTPTGWRTPRKWPQWYTIDRLKPGELPGSLHAEYRRCGKPTCRCASGDPADRHGPYWVRRWRDEDGRQRKAYVKAADLDATRAAIEQRNARLADERERRKKHMRRGEYAWRARHPEKAARQQAARERPQSGGHDNL